MAKFALIVLCALFSITVSQNTGRYRPFPSVSIISKNDGRFRNEAISDGRYVADNSGQYNANDGRYVPDESGRYNGDGSGAYSGDNGRYNPDGSGKYTGTNDKYKGDRFGGGAGGRGDSGIGASKSRFGTGSDFSRVKESLIGNGLSPGAGFGQPVAGKQGSAAGKYDNRHYAILRQEGTVEEDGYHYLYETENGITGEEQGKLHNRGTDDEAMKANGFFTYTGPDNIIYTVRYTADENGFVPEGDHIPTPPPIPEAIARALEYQRQQGTL